MDQQSVISLLLKVGGQETLETLRKSTANYQALLAELPRQLAAGKITAEEFTRSQASLAREHQRQAELLDRLERAERDAAAAGDAWAAVLREVDSAAQSTDHAVGGLASKVGQAADAKRNLGRAALEGGRALQDFAQGGVGGVLNNIEGLASALGGGPGLAGVMTAVGLAAFFALPHIKAWWAGLQEGANAVPQAKDKLGQLNQELETNRTRLDELKQQQTLTNRELAEFNRLTGEATRLEKEKNAEAEKQAKIEALRADPGKEAKGRGSAFTAAMDGRAEDVEAGLAKAMQSEQKARVEEYAQIAARKLKAMLEDPNVTQAEYEAARDREGETIEQLKRVDQVGDQKNARDLVVRASEGDQSAIDRIAQLAGRGGSAALTGTRDRYARTSPQARRQQEADYEGQKALAEAFQAEAELGMETPKDKLKKKAARGKEFEDWFNAQVAGVDAETKTAEQAQAKRQAADKEQAQRVAQAVAQNTGLDEIAGAAAADLRRQGASEDEITQRLAPILTQAIRAAFPGVGQTQAMGAGASLAGAAAKDSAEAMLGLGGDSVGLAQKGLSVMQAMRAELDRIRATQDMVNTGLDDLLMRTRSPQRRAR